MKRLALVGASLVLVGGAAAACGSSPEDADKDEFCSAMETFLGSENEDDFDKNQDKLEDVGTPEEVDGDARKGFEYLIDLDWDDREDEPTGDDKKETDAFLEKYVDTCMDQQQSDLEDQMNDLETEMEGTEPGTDPTE